VARDRRRALDPGELGPDLVAERAGDAARLLGARRRDLDVEALRADRPGAFVLEPREELPQDAEARRHDAARVPGVHPFVQDVDAKVADDGAAQRGRAPELVVVATARVEADDERGRADAIGEPLDVERQVEAATLLAALDEE